MPALRSPLLQKDFPYSKVYLCSAKLLLRCKDKQLFSIIKEMIIKSLIITTMITTPLAFGCTLLFHLPLTVNLNHGDGDFLLGAVTIAQQEEGVHPMQNFLITVQLYSKQIIADFESWTAQNIRSTSQRTGSGTRDLDYFSAHSLENTSDRGQIRKHGRFP